MESEVEEVGASIFLPSMHHHCRVLLPKPETDGGEVGRKRENCI